MQNQFETEAAPETVYTPRTIPQAELKTPQTQVARNTQDVHESLAKMKQEVRHHTIQSWSITLGMGACALLPNWFLSHFTPNIASYFLWTDLLVLIALFILRLKVFRAKPNWNPEELAQIVGVEAVGTLIDLLSIPGANRNFLPLTATLSTLLPQRKAEEGNLLTAEQRRVLYRTLYYGSSDSTPSVGIQQYLLAILKAMEQIGDAEALRIVTLLANGKADTVLQKELKAAAQQSLPLLQVRLAQLDAGRTLLRGSSPEQRPPRTTIKPLPSLFPSPRINRRLTASFMRKSGRALSA